jgi:glycosyltransferase involved in cell wall biosynthesis
MERRSVRPDVTIVIPARNEAKTIGEALASVAEQAWPLERLEVVVVDNGSTDGTPAAVREFQRTFPWLRVRLLSEPQPGVSRARNRGAEAAHGHVLLFLDADSRLAPTMIPAVLGHLHRGEAAVSLRVVADSNDPIDRAFFFLATWAKERLRIADDYDLLRRIRAAGWRVGFVTESSVLTSPRRLRRWPLRMGLLVTALQWLVALAGIGQDWPY